MAGVSPSEASSGVCGAKLVFPEVPVSRGHVYLQYSTREKQVNKCNICKYIHTQL